LKRGLHSFTGASGLASAAQSYLQLPTPPRLPTTTYPSVGCDGVMGKRVRMLQGGEGRRREAEISSPVLPYFLMWRGVDFLPRLQLKHQIEATIRSIRSGAFLHQG